MHASPHLMFTGDCEEAFRFYERSLGGKILRLVKYGDAPMGKGVPPDWQGKVVHGSLQLGREMIAGLDVVPKRYQRPQGFYVLLDVDDPAKAKHAFRKLSEKGRVEMPLQKTFWSPAFGVVVDRFGIPWEVNCSQPTRPTSRPRKRRHKGH